MKAEYLNSGEHFKGVAAAELNSGDIVFDEMERAGVVTSQTPVLAGQSYSAQACGRYRVKCKSTDTFDASANELVYWDESENEATSTSTGNKVIGKADADKASGETTVDVLLNSHGKSA